MTPIAMAMRRWQWHEVYWSGPKLRCTTWTAGVPWLSVGRGLGILFIHGTYRKMWENMGKYQTYSENI